MNNPVVQKDPGRAKQNSQGTAGRNFTKPRTSHFFGFCMMWFDNLILIFFSTLGGWNGLPRLALMVEWALSTSFFRPDNFSENSAWLYCTNIQLCDAAACIKSSWHLIYHVNKSFFLTSTWGSFIIIKLRTKAFWKNRQYVHSDYPAALQWI